MSKKLKVVVADDEPLARERIRRLLEPQPDVQLVGEARDGAEALTAIHAFSPDLVFLDVQMPEMSGFEVIDAVGAERMPLVIFVTAYDQHALKAFEVRALDYLLKPFDDERFTRTLERARRQIARAADPAERLRPLVNGGRGDGPRTDRLVVKSGGRLVFLPTADIDWVEADGNYVRVHAGTSAHLIRETMTSIEGRLDPERFVRIHRSRIVNLERVQEVQPWVNGEYAVLLRSGTRLALSRGYRQKLQARLRKEVA